MPAFLKWFLVVLAVFVLFSCSSSHSPADSDIISDSDSDDIETVADDTDSEEEESYVSVDDEDTLNTIFEIFKEKFKDEFNFIDED